MILKEKSDFIGKKVLSLELGLATITGVESIDENNFFYIVQKNGENLKRYYPIEGKRGFRFLSTRGEIIDSINKCKTFSSPIIFETSKARVNYFKKESRNQNISDLFILFRTLCFLKTPNKFEANLLNKLTGSLLVEISLVFEISLDESKQILRPIAGA